MTTKTESTETATVTVAGKTYQLDTFAGKWKCPKRDCSRRLPTTGGVAQHLRMSHDETVEFREGPCLTCGAKIHRTHNLPDQKYCSHECAHIADREGMIPNGFRSDLVSSTDNASQQSLNRETTDLDD